MYKVFVDDKAISIGGEAPIDSQFRKKKAKDLIENFGLDKWLNRHADVGSFFVKTKNPENIFDLLFKDYKWIYASGGVVTNDNEEYLFIKRLGKWDLPKGKRENGETSEETAVREVQEECNLENVKLKSFLKTTYHAFQNKSGVNCLKLTDWYLMKYKGQNSGSPQIAEGITKIAWLKKENWAKVYKNTWAMIADLLQEIN